MKKIVCLAILISPLGLIAQSTAHYVAIKTGMNMRDKPDVSGKVIEKIPYATAITLLESDEEAKLIKTENLNGKWKKVKYNNKTGYVVDSYLFPIPPPKATVKTVKDYFTQTTAVFGNKLIVKSGTKDEEDGGWELHKQLYKNGAECHKFIGYEYGSDTYFIPNFTMQQAFLLLRMIPEFATVIGEKDVFPIEDTTIKKGQLEYKIKVEKEEFVTGYPWVKRIRIEFEDAAIYSFEMYEVDNQVVVFFGSGV